MAGSGQSKTSSSGDRHLTDAAPARWRYLALLASGELLGMSLWFAASAVAPQLAALWSLTPAQSAWLITIVQLGFVAGTATSAILNLADIVPSRLLFAVAAALAAIANAAVLRAPGFESALALRFFTGFFLAGVYPPAMKMVATWFQSQRGLAIGTIVGALTIGKATPYLIHAFPLADATPVLLVASGGAMLGALLVGLFFREGPFRFVPRVFSWSLVASVVRIREWRLSTGSYLGHMFELYAFWAWVPSFLAASAPGARPSTVSLIAFTTIAIGGAGCVWGGISADKKGRERLVTISLVVSGGCCLGSVMFFGAPLLGLSLITFVWGFFVIADSAQFSTLVTESVPQHAIGTALTLQTSLGFLLTMIPVQLVPLLAGRAGWRWAFVALSIGPMAGIVAIRKLRLLRAPPAPA
ncbi:MAG: MFS transporter [Gemmatimonadota bacterium]|nr:MFS transporter [Gemmatimonadota bacterium]